MGSVSAGRVLRAVCELCEVVRVRGCYELCVRL